MRALTLACVLFATTAEAQTDPEARRYFLQGNAAAAAGRYTDALANYRAAYQRVERPNLLFDIAHCEELLGDDESAHADYRRFLERAEPANPLRSTASARIAELAGRLGARLRVTSDPRDAAIFVDGGEPVAGRTPALLRLSPGRHRLRLVADHAQPRDIDVDAVAGALSAVDVPLARLAIVEITAEPPDAEILRLDGPPQAAAGRWRAEDTPGTWRFRVQRAGLGAATVEVTVRAGDFVHRQVRLADAPATLLVHSSVAGAAVFVDALPAGVTSARSEPLLLQVRAGLHQVSVAHLGFASWSGHVRMVAGETTTLATRLAAHRSRAARLGTWGLAGAGAAALVAGAVVGVAALDDYSQFEGMRSKAVADSFHSRALAADLLLATGAAALVGAAIVHHRSTELSEARIDTGASP